MIQWKNGILSEFFSVLTPQDCVARLSVKKQMSKDCMISSIWKWKNDSYRNLAICTKLFQQEAEQNGNILEMQLLQQQIDALDGRAAELERRRTQSTRGISWINQRNRQAMKDAVFSGQLHIEASSEYDPFTRKNARTKPVFGKDKRSDDTASGGVIEVNTNYKNASFFSKTIEKTGNIGSKRTVDDLFSAHDFEVDVDIVLPPTVASLGTHSLNSVDTLSHKSPASSTDSVNRPRPLTLEEYRLRKAQMLAFGTYINTVLQSWLDSSVLKSYVMRPFPIYSRNGLKDYTILCKIHRWIVQPHRWIRAVTHPSWAVASLHEQ
ncbi:unnamed protein product [Dracunculus medinensis]|uniref:Uncharacterized protein n=1 Tax=Dracunculus medinensis TaxID=318479 RepID=A0A0N4U498_DRAME|nr:unnamed protein product [Dracunculus medinensis]